MDRSLTDAGGRVYVTDQCPSLEAGLALGGGAGTTKEDSDSSTVYTISGLYSRPPSLPLNPLLSPPVPPPPPLSEDSEVTESTCTSTYEFVNSTDRGERIDFVLQQAGLEQSSEVSEECGICSFRPRCLQRYANIKVFVMLCCVLVTLQQTLSSGYLNSVITTIEKRFDIPSGLSGGIASTYELGNLITIIFVSYLGSRRHIPVWLGMGILLMGVGSLVFVLPHFITQHYTTEEHMENNDTDKNICRPATVDHHNAGGFLGHQAAGGIHDPETCIDGTRSNGLTVFIFMVAQLMIGCGASPLFTLGTTYIDDHVKRDSSSMYIGCVYSMVAFGPVCGFLLGGFLLSYYVDWMNYDATDLNITPRHPRWVGAWWGGFLIIGVLLIIVAIPFFSFPKSMKHEKRKILLEEYRKSLPKGGGVGGSGGVLVTRASEEQNSTYGRRVKDIPQSIWKLLCNPVYVITCLASCMELMIVGGFVVFLPKYLENQFSIGKSQANVFTGGIAIPGACIGVFMGGYILKKLQLTPKGAIQFVMFFNAFCLALYALVFFLGCDNVKMAGATMPYSESVNRADEFEVNLTAVCNMGCECSPNDIQPICGNNGITYFSPCHAGCTSLKTTSREHHSLNYFNCACILSNSSGESFQEVTVVPVATSGPCTNICKTIVPFMLILFVMSLAVSITQMPLLMIVLRSVSNEERSFALGMQFVIFRLFGYIPSPIIFGNVIDSTCLLWKANCSERGGFCLMYDIEQFRFRYVGICTGIKVLAGLLFWFDWWLIRQRCCTGDLWSTPETSSPPPPAPPLNPPPLTNKTDLYGTTATDRRKREREREHCLLAKERRNSLEEERDEEGGKGIGLSYESSI